MSAHEVPISKKRVQVLPSLLSADFAHLSREIARMEQGGADGFHLDVMDGHFVPNLSMGSAIVAAVNRVTELPLDVHLMIYRPFDYIESFIAAGADSITIHIEATEDVEETLRFIHTCGIKAGLALCPNTPLSLLRRYLPLLDILLVMSVEPGFGGQHFMAEMLEKVGEAALWRKEEGVDSLLIEIDGGIDAESAPLARRAGADLLVAGTYLFAGDDVKQRIARLRGEEE